MFEIRQAGAKGFGVFASRHVPRGTRILAERPLLDVDNASGVYRATGLLSSTDRNELRRLSLSSLETQSVSQWVEAAWHVFKANAVAVFSKNSQWPSRRLIQDHMRILGIFRNNNFDLGNNTQTRQAVFKNISRINHACLPNCQGNFNAALGRFTVHTTSAVESGEEFTISYLAENGDLRTSRRSKLEAHYGFLCDCSICNQDSEKGRLSEARRRMNRERLEAFATSTAEAVHPDLLAELKLTEEMVAMFDEEGVRGREAATIHLAAAELSMKAGEEDKARDYAKKGLRIEKECLGDDNPMYSRSLKRMEVLGLDCRSLVS